MIDDSQLIDAALRSTQPEHPEQLLADLKSMAPVFSKLKRLAKTLQKNIANSESALYAAQEAIDALLESKQEVPKWLLNKLHRHDYNLVRDMSTLQGVVAQLERYAAELVRAEYGYVQKNGPNAGERRV